MKKFKFKLEPVLNIRKSKEEKIQMEMAKANDQLNEAILELQEIQDHKNKIASQLEEFKVNPFGIEDLIIYQNYLETLEQRIIAQTHLVEERNKEVERIRSLLLEACKEKKAIEKIKEKRKNNFMAEALKHEIDFLDEIGIIRNARKNLNAS